MQLSLYGVLSILLFSAGFICLGCGANQRLSARNVTGAQPLTVTPCPTCNELIRDGSFEDEAASESGVIQGYNGVPEHADFGGLHKVWMVSALPPQGPAGVTATLVSNRSSGSPQTAMPTPNTPNSNAGRGYFTPCGNNYASLSIGPNSNTILSQEIVTDLIQGQTYRLRFCQAGDSGSRASWTGYIHVQIATRPVSGNPIIAFDQPGPDLPGAPADNTWQERSWTFTVNTTSRYFINFIADKTFLDSVGSGVSQTCPAFIDNVSLKPEP